MYKIAFIGFGKSAHRYHLPFIDTSKYQVIGYYKRSDSQFEMPYPKLPKDLKRFASVEELLNSDCDLVVITTPAPNHYDYAVKALNHKKNVIVEKPFTLTTKEAYHLFSLAKYNNVKVLPYQNRRYDSDFLTAKEIVSNKKYGETFEIESLHSYYRDQQVETQYELTSGSIYGHAVHFIDQIVSIYGEPEDVIYTFKNQRNQLLHNYSKPANEDSYDIIMIYSNVKVRIYFSSLVAKQTYRFIINTSKLTALKLNIDNQEQYLKQGIFPYDKQFNIDEDNFSLNYPDQSEEKLSSIKLNYTQYYEDFYKFLKHDKEFITETQVLVVLNIMEHLVHHKPFEKLDI